MSLIVPDADQLALARGVADFLADAFPLARIREGRARDTDRWEELAGLGLFGMALAEDQGGLGLSIVEEALVARELGKALVSPAVIGAMLAPRLSDDPALLNGERQVGIAIGTIDGEARVIDGEGGLFLLIEDGALSLVEASGRPLPCIDDSLHLSAAPWPGMRLAQIQNPTLVLAAHILAAALLTGLLETTRDMAADFARTRVQFGRPIGAFQAIKHRCADAALGAEMSWAQLWHAAKALEAQAPDAPFQARAAKWLAGDEALKAARFDIQAHGGMGFTQEVDAQLLLKRTHVLHQMFGDPRLVPATLATLPMEV